MGGSCSCFESAKSIYLKTGELEYIVSSETYQDTDPYHVYKNEEIQVFLRQLSKSYLVKLYINYLKSPSLFKLPYSKVNVPLKSLESDLVKSTELEYGEYRTSPIWGEFTIPAPLVLVNDTYYQGEWHMITKLQHGVGTSYNKTSNEKYSGNYRNGKKHGLGRLVFGNGDLYEGEFSDDEIHGNGTLLYIDGKAYFGEFSKGFKHGYGKEQDRHETCYEGDFNKDKRQGQGKLIWADGRCYVGEFANDRIEGVGECWWPDEKRYYGQWEKDKMHGQGECIWEDGKEYVGEFYKDVQDGNGKMKFANGDIYEGVWRNGKQHGFGTLITEGKEMKGLWENGTLVKWIE